ncbi:MAG: cytosine/uracil/thiamine/allantoin permease [Paracoccaceae bacterium]|jgi:cytosine/uracil/thiamine/allantoin permease
MFTKVGWGVSLLIVIFGFAAIIASFFVAPDVWSPDFTRASMKQSTLWMRQGSTLVYLGLLLGVFCEISQKLKKKDPRSEVPEGLAQL